MFRVPSKYKVVVVANVQWEMTWCDSEAWCMKAVSPAVAILAKLNIQVANVIIYTPQ